MRISRVWTAAPALGILLLSILHCAFAQDQTDQPGVMKGKIVARPERLSGLWEMAIGSGEVVGIHLMLITKIEGAATSLTSVPQYLEYLQVGVYQRNKELKFGDENFFGDSGEGGAQWDGKRLLLKFVPRTAEDMAIDLDLTYDEKLETWSGRFHRGGFSGDVILRRPGAGNAMTGTWVSDSPGMNGCVHIVQQLDGTLVGWSDVLQMPGLYRYANGLKPPNESLEHYGNLVKVTQTSPETLLIEFNAYGAMCCSHTFAAIVSADGTIFNGGWQAGPNQYPFKATWSKVHGDSCRLK
jgi:hypothetical protein